AEVGGDPVAAGLKGELDGPGADLRPVGADDQQRVLPGPGQVGGAELTGAVEHPAAPLLEDVSPAVLRLGLFERRVGQEVVAGPPRPGPRGAGGRGPKRVAWPSSSAPCGRPGDNQDTIAPWQPDPLPAVQP